MTHANISLNNNLSTNPILHIKIPSSLITRHNKHPKAIFAYQHNYYVRINEDSFTESRQNYAICACKTNISICFKIIYIALLLLILSSNILKVCIELKLVLFSYKELGF